ncbi:CCAAT/enhancer-binding protein zeta isoform X3 [Marmota marmota marmota]|uniref:CCAAT/enhancer-binding protein zeta isoform X3 n=1 Tax=Marmota marmota marmota TaxID=9994 RepID=UPI002092C6C3|nr:CCAAT/enhancer-binding protein zeta isoform X3 [Marmota marmota marmota]
MAAAKASLEFHAKRPWAGQEAVGDPDEEDEDDSGEAENGFSLEEVLRLGGTKQDYLMLATLDENEEVVDGGKKGAVDDLQQGELEAFIQNLSLAKYAKSFIEDDEQPKKENASKKESKVSNIDNKKQNAAERERTSINKVKNKRPEQRSDKNSGTISKVKKDKQQDIFEFSERQTLLLKPGGKWYDLDYTSEYSLESQPQDIVSKYKTLAQKLYEHEVNLFKSKTNNQKGASSTWMKAIVSSGTLGDRMAAMILLIQDDAIHTLQFVETLVNLVKKKGSKQQCLMALDTFKELLITDLLPESRKLRIFSQRPFNKLEQLSSGNKDSRDRRKMLDPGLMMCSKQAMFLNLVYKSLKADIVLRRVKAFVKRLLQVTCTQMPPFICGALYLVSEIFKAKPGLRSQLNDHPESDDEENFVDIGDDEDIEKFTDADKETEMDTMKKVQTEEAVPESDTDTTKPKTPSWVHFDNLKGGKQLKTYDPFSRNPLFCGAENTSLWELKKLSEHFHPSVALFAKTILQGNYIQYSGDPLQDFTLMRFLDRFVYRNPKPHKGKENTDSVVMQPKRKHFSKDTHGLAVNSKEFLAKEESQIPVDEVFFHRYYKKVAIVKEKQKRSADEESIEDVDDEEFEKMIDTFEDDNCFTPGKDDLDFASNMKKKTKKAKDNLEYEDSEDSDDEFDNLDDDEVSLGSMNDEEFAEIDEDGGTFMDVLDDENESIPESDEDSSKVNTKRSKRKDDDDFDFAGSFQGPRKKKKRNLSDSSLFVSAEEFGHLLDENVGSKFDNIGINAMANKDNASLKQLRWEAERDDWLHNRDVKSIIKKKKNFKKRQKPTHKTKKQRK